MPFSVIQVTIRYEVCHINFSCIPFFLPFPNRKADPEGKLPEESLDAVGLKQIFSRKGFA